MEWNACALADSTTIPILDTRLGLESRLEVCRGLRKYVGMYVQKFAFLASVTRQTEVVYKELHLKATQKCYHSCPEGQKPELGNSESGVGFFTCTHAIFIACKPFQASKWPSAKSPPAPLSPLLREVLYIF